MNRSAEGGARSSLNYEGEGNLMPPFPGQGVCGTGPRCQGCPEGKLFQRRENFSLRRSAPSTALVPFPKTTWISGKGGHGKGSGSWLTPALMTGQTAASKVTGAAPLRPRVEKIRNNPLTGGGLLMEAATVSERCPPCFARLRDVKPALRPCCIRALLTV